MIWGTVAIGLLGYVLWNLILFFMGAMMGKIVSAMFLGMFVVTLVVAGSFFYRLGKLKG